MGVAIDVLCGSHGNEYLGVAFHMLWQESETPPELRSHLVHTEAIAQGQRFLDLKEITSHYPTEQSADPEPQPASDDPEDAAADDTLQWLGPHAGSENVVVYDIHNSSTPQARFCVIGTRALKATVAGAYLLGYPRCLVTDAPLYQAVPNAAALETPVTDPTRYNASAEKLLAGLGEISLLSAEELNARYDEIAAKMQFFRAYEIMTAPDDTHVAPYIHALEKMEIATAFTPLTADELPKELLTALGLNSHGKIFTGSWGHRNMSPLRPDLGVTTIADRQVARRLCFGAMYQQIDPPVGDGKWITYPSP